MLALAACGGGGGSSDATPPTSTDGSTPAPTTPEPSTPAPTPATQIPEALRGQWEAILTYVPPYYVSPYGTVQEGDGSLGVSFFFYPDGRYQHAWNSLQTYFGGNCIRTGQWQEVGTLSNVGADFTFTPGRASYLQTDTCGQFKVVDPAPVSPGTHTLTLDHDDTGWPLLRVSFPTGELVLEKCRHCQ
jgi:hypothetical protein